MTSTSDATATPILIVCDVSSSVAPEKYHPLLKHTSNHRRPWSRTKIKS